MWRPFPPAGSCYACCADCACCASCASCACCIRSAWCPARPLRVLQVLRVLRLGVHCSTAPAASVVSRKRRLEAEVQLLLAGDGWRSAWPSR